MDGDKTYSGTIQLGRTTTTQDIEGEILKNQTLRCNRRTN